MMRIATAFSGIGAIEEALKKMNIDHEIVFACDNGERELNIPREEIEKSIAGMSIEEKNQYIEKLYLENAKKDNFMQKQYMANFDVNKSHYYQDIRFLDATNYHDIDLLVGGSPCQSFSLIGKRGGLEDTRGTLFYEYARIIKESQPKNFIYENVLGMLTHDKGKTWETILKVFESLNYNLKLFVLNAKDYGIPQDRKRIFLVGTKCENHIDEPQKIELTTKVSNYLEKNIPVKYYLGQKGFEFVTNPYYSNRAQVNQDVMKCQKANQQFNWNGDFVFEPYDKKKHTDEIMQRAYLGEYKGIQGVARQMTPRECLKLMGFSDEYKIVVHDTMAWRQSGNAIVVNVLEAIVKEMIEKGLLEC